MCVLTLRMAERNCHRWSLAAGRWSQVPEKREMREMSPVSHRAAAKSLTAVVSFQNRLLLVFLHKEDEKTALVTADLSLSLSLSRD